METADKTIEFRIIKITEESFTLSYDAMLAVESCNELSLQISFCPNLKIEKEIIDIHIGVEYKRPDSDGDDVRILQLSIINTFKVKNIEEVFKSSSDNEGQNFEGNSNFMEELLRISIGALRGALAIKTSGTPLSDCPLPIISTSDLLFDLLPEQ